MKKQGFSDIVISVYEIYGLYSSMGALVFTQLSSFVGILVLGHKKW